MIRPDFIVRDRKGYYCSYGDFYLDPSQPVKHAVISHAHGDHASPGHEFAYCTAPTASFMEHRFASMHWPEFRRLDFHEDFNLGGVKLCFIPAGHILGSAQILMEYQGVRYLYTGDYKLQADPTCEAYEGVAADVLITETTFADPAIEHPAAEDEILKLRPTRENIMLGAYALGKAQRLTALIHEHCPEKRIWIHHSIIPIHRIYEHYGRSLGAYELYHRKALKAPDTTHQVYLVPPMAFRSYIRAKNVVRVFASGWAHHQRNNPLSLFISDHVDWKDILHVIALVEPREIWTIHGEGKHLAAHFQGRLPVKSL